MHSTVSVASVEHLDGTKAGPVAFQRWAVYVGICRLIDYDMAYKPNRMEGRVECFKRAYFPRQKVIS